MRRAIKHRRVGLEDILRAVAVMHVPVDDRNALQPVLLLRMTRGNRGIVEEAEAHGAHSLGMMPRRARGDEGIVMAAGNDVIHRGHRPADAGERRLQALHAGIGVALELVDLILVLRHGAHDGKEMLLRMRQQHRILICLRCFLPVERGEIRMAQRLVERP